MQEHVLDRIKHFAVVFAQELVPGITQQQLDLAFSRALYSISAQETNGTQAQLELKFNHQCRCDPAAMPAAAAQYASSAADRTRLLLCMSGSWAV